ncbi:MAG: D-aminoacylase [Gemmatimonadota bacterium]|nr:D-aminoacylase [Gemmatimonadota bacterium]MDQ8151284.1 D-aminoacylase [Gemmatimonadota bacterium]MDQ8152821.1 D-aminoacylase [Gemmatimonadota bacterium]MDQ8170607.1 D-aminoacylase [Gemmatimonadota bacterium]MDQ8174823.1 D-aminoacylase [Gemmatimonadota bacterium]
MRQRLAFPVLLVAFVGACTPLRTPITRSIGTSAYDLVIENGRIVDGTGAAWSYGDLAIRGDRIAAIGPRGAFRDARTSQRIDATGHVVAPGFIDIQAHSLWHYLRGNGLALSMVMQGITTAIHGEGSSYGPVNDRILAAESDTAMRRILAGFTGPRGFGDWLDHMVARGTAQNVGSFLGDGTLRRYVKGEDGGPLSAAERDTARAMVARAMRDGAFGIASALIYPPNTYASTEELIDAAEAMAPYGGIYITHMRSEGDKFLEAMDEALRIGREGGVPVEIYHLKASGPRNWPKMPLAIAKIDSARTAGQDVQANMYLYPAGGNSFASCIPPKYAEGGKLLENLKNRSLRGTMVAEMQARDAGYENLCEIAGPEGVMVVGFRTPELQRFEGKRLSEIAAALGTTWPEAIIDLNVAESLGLGEILFLMSEENMRLQLKQPWMKFGTDAGAQDPATARGSTHPRAYGNFPRIFRKYVREEGVLPLEDAVRKASSAVATRLSLTDRGVLKVGLKADVIVFDPATITDHATFEQPHQLSTGMRDVFVNGVAVVREGRHTGAKPGQVVRGPGYRP